MEFSSVALADTSESEITVDSQVTSIDPLQAQRFDPRTADYAKDLLAITTYALRLDIPHIDFNEEEQGVLGRTRPYFIRPERHAHVLGTGVSCSVSLHQLPRDITETIPKGKFVVLKRYHERTSLLAHEKKKDQKLQYTSILQELQVFMHPFLQTTQNISKLLYLVWTDESLIPLFALEHASYGTLEQFLHRNPEMVSVKVKLDLSVDIASGVSALHACDFVHGDIKPANVLIHEHDGRDVIAKISDFCGAADRHKFGTGEHIRFTTEDWSPLEVSEQASNIDWQKSDVYSLGLVVAHIWYDPSYSGACFLYDLWESFQTSLKEVAFQESTVDLRKLKRLLGKEEAELRDTLISQIIARDNIVGRTCEVDNSSGQESHGTATEPMIAQSVYLIAKTHGTSGRTISELAESTWSDESSDTVSSPIPTSLPANVGTEPTDLTGTQKIEKTELFSNDPPNLVLNIICLWTIELLSNIMKSLQSVLKLEQNDRVTALEFAHSLSNVTLAKFWRGELQKYEQERARVRPRKRSSGYVLQNQKALLNLEKVIMPAFRKRSRKFQTLAFDYILRTLDPMQDVVECFLPDLDVSRHRDDLAVLKWCYANNILAQESLAKDFQTFASWWTLAECYLLGTGVLVNEQKALQALTIAARGAISVAMAIALPLFESCPNSNRDTSKDRPMLWLTYGMRNGYWESTDLLRAKYPELYRTLRRIMVGRQLFGLETENDLVSRDINPCTFYQFLLQLQVSGNNLVNQKQALLQSVVNSGLPTFQIAAAFADVSTVSLLLKKLGNSSVNTLDGAERSALWYAIEAENVEVVQLFLANGAQATHIDSQGLSLLHRVVYSDDSTACTMTSLLLEYGADLTHMAFESGTAQGNFHIKFSMAKATPLVWAVIRNRPRLFALLLSRHYRDDIPIQIELWVLILSEIALHHRVEMFECLMTIGKTSPQNPDPQILLMNNGFRTLMLGTCVHEHTHNAIEGRLQLGSYFRSRQRSLIQQLLRLGADPLAEAETGSAICAMQSALHNGDSLALESFLAHSQSKGINPWDVLTTDAIKVAKYGIITLLKSKCIDGFQWALQRYPKLANLVIKDHGSLLSAAMCFGQPEHVRLLLKAGADRYNADASTESTVLEQAITLERLDMADVLVEDADVPRLLGTPTKLGSTLFGVMLNRAAATGRRVKLETFQWLQRHNAIQFRPNVNLQAMTVWRIFFSRRFHVRYDTKDDLQLLDFLTQPDTFLDQIGATDMTGQSAIHYAARFGTLETVQLLLDKGADVNQEVVVVANSMLQAPPTATPLQMASVASMSVPKYLVDGSTWSIQSWKEDCVKKLKYIEKQGGKRGRYQRLLDRAFFGTEWFVPKSDFYPGKLTAGGIEGQWPLKYSRETARPGKEKDAERSETIPAEMDSMASLFSRMQAGQGTADDVEEVISSYARMSIDKIFDDGNSNHRPAPDVPEESVPIEETEDEQEDVQPTVKEANVMRWIALLEQEPFRGYMKSYFRLLQEHDVDFKKDV